MDTRQAAFRHSWQGARPNSHWLSRLPGHIKSPKVRQHVVEDLRSVISAMAPDNPFKPAHIRHAASP